MSFYDTMKLIGYPIKNVLKQFKKLSTALIDSSSIIYMEKADFFGIVLSSIELYSIEEILAEVRQPYPQIKKINSDLRGETNDQKLIECAAKYGYPIISEDSKILRAAELLKVPYYNSLMILNFLIFKGEITQIQYSKFMEKLEAIAWYSDDVWEYGQRVFLSILSAKSRRLN